MAGILVSIMSIIDFWVYSFAAKMFNLIFFIADVDIFSDTAINGLTKRVYIILGVVILFKIIISCVQYLINPDQMSDKEKGFGSIIQKTIISIALLALVPTIFDFAKSVQRTVSSAIPSIILNANIQIDSDIEYNEKVGDWMSFTVLTSFIHLKDDAKEPDIPITDFDTFRLSIANNCGWGFGDSCSYNYQWIFSVPCGIFLVYILLSMGLEIAIRTIKLGLLEILAPIPIASYIDNKKSFDKWKDLSIKVYLDLFVRLIVIYIVIYVMTLLANKETYDKMLDGIPIEYKPFIVIYLILALLMFAKSAPKFICDILGIDSKGEGIGEMFKPAWSRAGGLAAGAGMLTAGIGNAANRLKGWKDMSGRDRVKALRDAAKSGVAGAASAGFHGGIAALQGKSGKEVMAAGHKRAIAARQNSDVDKATGVSPHHRMAVRANDFFGLDTDASLAEGRQKAYSTIHQDVGNYKKAVLGRLEKNSMIRINDQSSAIEKLGYMLEQSSASIRSSGNSTLISALDSFERGSDGKMKLKDGTHFTFSQLHAISQASELTKGCEQLSYLAKNDILRDAEKSLFNDTMAGNVYDAFGKKATEFDAKTGHLDIRNAVSNAYSDIAKHALQISNIEIDGVNYQGSQELINAFVKKFAKFDDILQERNEAISREVNTNKDAAARASIQRRDANNKQGK